MSGGAVLQREADHEASLSGVGGSEHCDVIAYTSVVDEHRCDESGETSGEQRSDESDELLKIQNSF